MVFDTTPANEQLPATNYFIFWLSLAAVLFFAVTSYFSWNLRSPYSGPDETAQAFFIHEYARGGSLRVAEPLNTSVEDSIHPRSMSVARHDLAPGTFIGLILFYGSIARAVGTWIIPFLTPFFAALGAILFYWFLRVVFAERVARWASLLLLFHPAWAYYSSRSLFSANVVFSVFLIAGVVLVLSHHGRWWAWLCAGILIGESLAMRTTEGGWVLGSLLMLALIYRKSIPAHSVFLFLLGCLLPFLPVLYHQSMIYGHPLYTGYARVDSDLLPIVSPWKFSSPLPALLAALFLPFGFRPDVIVANVYQYLLWLFWWFAIPTVLGVVIVLRKNRRTEEPKNSSFVHTFLGAYVFLAVWLIIYYGSYAFLDSTLPGPTIGTSYVRYWLPISVFGLPFAVMALHAIQWRWVRMSAVLGIILFSLTVTFVSTDESLIPSVYRTREVREVASRILQHTPPTAVFMTDRSDKLFFPARRVIFYDPLGRRQIDRLLPRVLAAAPVYYFTELSDRDIDFMNRQHLAVHGIAWRDGEEIGGMRLYNLERIRN